MRRLLLTILPLAVIIAVPVLLRTRSEEVDESADQLVIVSPHNESIRYEFDRAFREYYWRTTGRKVSIDWRNIGGTSDIVRYLNSAFTSAFRVHWTKELGNEWTEEVVRDFMNPQVKGEDSPARKAFLESETGVGIDLFFGGGQYDLARQSAMGTLVPAGFRKRHPELFAGEDAVLLPGGGGEVWYDEGDCYYGTCFSTFGICANLERLSALGISQSELDAWDILGDGRLLSGVGLADPTMSGSVNKCYEMMIQRKMQERMREPAPEAGPGALDAAWEEALLLLKRIGGNARYLTFSAGKVPVDCANGQICAGMCIDFYGRSQAVWEERHVGRRTMVYVTPKAASTVSCDPIGIFRGAPNRERAEMFLDFVMSKEGQRLWNRRRGVPGGPVKYDLNRLPVRRDLYTAEERAWMGSPEAEPFELANSFIYQGDWTKSYFGLIRTLVRVMLIDCHEELRSCWRAICEAGGTDVCPEAMKEFRRLPFPHSDAQAQAARLYTAEGHTAAVREWADFFRESYRRAEKLAMQQKEREIP